MELLQLTQLSDRAVTAALGVIPALAVYVVTQRDVRIAKEHVSTAREVAREELTSALEPALKAFKSEFRDDLLTGMNGTYLRTAEALIHFNNIKSTLERIEKRIDG